MVHSIVKDVLSDNTGSVASTPVEEEKKKRSRKSSGANEEKKSRKPREKNKAPSPTDEPIICPMCRKGHILKGRSAYGCSAWQEGCSFRLPFDTYGSELTREQLQKIANEKRDENG